MMVAGAAVDSRMVELSHVAHEVASLHLALNQIKEAIEVYNTALRLMIKAKGPTNLSVLLEQVRY